MNANASIFDRLLAVDVRAHVERKGKFDYLSWSYAVAELSTTCPDASWEVVRFPEPSTPQLLVPYCATPLGYFVEVAVTVAGKRRSQVHPVLDNNNKVIRQPTAFDINTSIQRCLVKAIALHGLGLSIYAGEDLAGLGDEERDRTDDEAPRRNGDPDARLKEAISATISAQLNDLAGDDKTKRKALVVNVLGREPDSLDDYKKVLAALQSRRSGSAKSKPPTPADDQPEV